MKQIWGGRFVGELVMAWRELYACVLVTLSAAENMTLWLNGASVCYKTDIVMGKTNFANAVVRIP